MLLPETIRVILDGGYAPHLDGRFRVIPIPQGTPLSESLFVHRLNGLGSLFYFIKIPLGRQRLTHNLHLPLCRQMESDHLNELWELPRDHFKSTVCGEGLPMWWALPFGQEEVDAFAALGYDSRFIAFMLRVHDACTRTVLISENITNAAKLGSKIRWHFESNAVYRALYPETLPSRSETWTAFSLSVRRSNASGSSAAHGEGTFDFLGVGSALQSRHYVRAVEDDLVGRKAIESPSIMEKTIDYHQLLPGAFESMDAIHLNDRLMVGNRWGYHDLNSFVREHEPWVNIHSHSALGGCCAEHPAGVAIFPEEFSVGKLDKLRKSLGSYRFSCQFLNNPCAPEDADFREEWLRYFDYDVRPDGKRRVRHEVHDGVVLKDIDINHLTKVLLVDPAHEGSAGEGRCRHAVVELGQSEDNNFYLLDYWAKQASYDAFFNAIYEMAAKWKNTRCGVETVAAQRYVKYHIEYRNGISGVYLKVVELKGEVELPDGQISRKKEFRIRNVLLPIFEQGRFWAKRNAIEFIEEYVQFPKGRFRDILDVCAYGPQLLRPCSFTKQMPAWIAENARRSREMATPYSSVIH